MSKHQSRLDLTIDVFEETAQRARVLPNLTPPEVVQAILQEFRELSYLGNVPDNYRLQKAKDNAVLDDETEMSHQVSDNDQLILMEVEKALPSGTHRPSKHIYLREIVEGTVYKLQWLPAIIGRPDKNQPYNDQVAVNLESYPASLRVSRRHVRITEEKGQYYIESMSRNPTSLKKGDGNPIPINSERQTLHHGDVISLERSEINLKFIIRNGKKEEASGG